MRALCIEATKNFVKGKEYEICPVLCGYQVTDENDETTGFTDDKFRKYFEVIR